jgi:hypothetical protein
MLAAIALSLALARALASHQRGRRSGKHWGVIQRQSGKRSTARTVDETSEQDREEEA